MSIYVVGNPVPSSAQSVKEAFAALPTENITARIEVGTTSVALGNKHLNVLYTLESESGGSLTIFLRGGPSTSPEGTFGQIPVVAAGMLGAVAADPTSDSPYGNVISTVGFLGPRNSETLFEGNRYPTSGLDYEVNSPRITVDEGTATEMLPKLYQLIDAFSDIQDSQHKYNPIYSNSNSAVFSALEKAGIQPGFPIENGEAVSAPGATSNFESGYLTKEVIEDVKHEIKDMADSLEEAAENFSEFVNETAEYIQNAFDIDVDDPLPEDYYDIVVGSEGGQTVPLTEEDRAIFIGKDEMDLVDYSRVTGDKGVHVNLKTSATFMEEVSGIKDYLDKAVANITGTKYDDVIIGNDKINVVNGGDGDDLISGGGGGDRFVFEYKKGDVDRITDFDVTDNNEKIDLSDESLGHLKALSDLNIESDGKGNSIIHLDDDPADGHRIIIENVHPIDLKEKHFIGIESVSPPLSETDKKVIEVTGTGGDDVINLKALYEMPEVSSKFRNDDFHNYLRDKLPRSYNYNWRDGEFREVNGGGGIDTANYNVFNGIEYMGRDLKMTIDLAEGRAEGWDRNDRLISIENVAGTGWDDTIKGDIGNNKITGAGGADDITGGGGSLSWPANDNFLRFRASRTS